MRRLVLALLLTTAFGCSKPTGTTSGRIDITADANGFTPAAVNLKKGETSTLVFTRKSDDTCASAVVFPELNIKKDLPLNVPVSIDVPTDQARTLKFTCGMGMYEASIVIK